MYYIGLMSGTSMDAVDTVVASFNESALDVIAYKEYPIDTSIQRRVRAVNQYSTIEEISALDSIMGQLFADAVLRILDDSDINAKSISAVGSHGQTVLHLPNTEHPRTLQIGDPNIISQRCGIKTIADFRRADMIVGGQGAPLAPAFHAWRFHSSEINRVILNIGGIANITLLYGEEVSGFDTGPGNGLLDLWIQHTKQENFDRNGEWAASGRCHDSLLKPMLDYHYFHLSPAKSTGKDEFNLDWLNRFITQCSTSLSPADIQASLLELSAHTISQAIWQYAKAADEILVCGGGVHNDLLMHTLRERLMPKEVHSTEKYGLDPNAVEALVFAWLAKQNIEGNPANIPSVTGATEKVILGGLYNPG